jgi:hypothetical protein
MFYEIFLADSEIIESTLRFDSFYSSELKTILLSWKMESKHS